MSSSFYTLVQSPSFAAAAHESATANEEDDHHTGAGAVVNNFIQQITGATYPKTWDQLTDQEQKKILSFLFEQGTYPKKVLFATLVQLEHISKKGPPFTTTTTAVELDNWNDDWKVGESRVLCLTSACTLNWAQIYSLEFVSQETGSVCTLEVQHDFNFRYSIPDKLFIVFNQKLKEKCKRLVFVATSSEKLVDFVEILNRSLATMNESTQRKLSSDSTVPITPPVAHNHSHPPPLSPGATSTAASATEHGDGNGHEPLTAKRIIEIIRKLFERKEDGNKEKRRIKKLDISGPTDFRHVQHFGAWDSTRANDSGALIVNNVQDLLKVPTTPNGTKATTAGGYPSPPNPASPTHDERTLSFIYDVIEECNSAPPPSRSVLRSDNRQTVQFPIVPHMTDSEIHSLFDTKHKSQTFGSNHERSKLIQDLKVQLQDEETRKLIFDFIETYKQEVKPEPDHGFEKEKSAPSPSPPTGRNNQVFTTTKWSSGRSSAPPPPKSPIGQGPATIKHYDGNEMEPGQGVYESPFNYSAVRDSLRVELQQNLESQTKLGCQEKGTTGFLSRSHTWSNNQLKGTNTTFNTLPSKPVLKPNQVKKTHSDVRRRPTSPPPPPMKDIQAGHKDEGEETRARNGNRSTPEPEEPVAVKKVLPPIPKPRTSKLIRRFNSNPSDPSENEPRYTNLSTNKSFDTESGVGVAPGEADGSLILPARPPVPPTANTLLVAELREKIDGINSK